MLKNTFGEVNSPRIDDCTKGTKYGDHPRQGAQKSPSNTPYFIATSLAFKLLHLDVLYCPIQRKDEPCRQAPEVDDRVLPLEERLLFMLVKVLYLSSTFAGFS